MRSRANISHLSEIGNSSRIPPAGFGPLAGREADMSTKWILCAILASLGIAGCNSAKSDVAETPASPTRSQPPEWAAAEESNSASVIMASQVQPIPDEDDDNADAVGEAAVSKPFPNETER